MKAVCSISTAMTLLVMSCTQALAVDVEGGWVARRCAAYQGGYCRVPFHVALGNAAELSRLSGGVQLRGYLVKEPEGFALYEDRNSAQRGWRTDAILVQTPKSMEISASLDKRNQSLVVMKGRIQLAELDTDEYWVQFSIDDPVTIAPIVGDKLKR